MSAIASTSAIAAHLDRGARWRLIEIVFWLAVVVLIFALPSRALLINEILIAGLFALSLDLILGYAGILSLGHAAFFGIGAYGAGIIANAGIAEPLLGLVLASLIAGALGLITAPLLLRGADLTRLMVTLGICLMLGELANRNSWATGGADGLNLELTPIFGLFPIGFTGQRNAALYSLIVLFVLFVVARRLVQSPFGLSVRALKENRLRAGALGISAPRRLIAIYALAATFAGAAGALVAQTTQIVSLDVFDFHRSADVMLMLIIGGAGYLYGGIIGAAFFIALKDGVASATPVYWEFWIGLLLVALVLGGRERIGARIGGASLRRFAGRPRRGVSAPALETRGLSRRFGGLTATDDISIKLEQGARHALIGPNGAGKTTLVNLLTGALRPSAGVVLLNGVDVTKLAGHQRVRRGLARTFQINQLFANLTPAESLCLAIGERLGRGARGFSLAGARQGGRRRGGGAARALRPCRRHGPQDAAARLWQAAPARNRAGARLPAARAVARRARRGRAGRRARGHSGGARGAARRGDDPTHRT